MKIEKIWREDEADRTKLCAKINISDEAIERWKTNSLIIDKKIGIRYRKDLIEDDSFIMWYSVNSKYSEALCFERCDAFVVAVLYFAMIAEEDIQSEVPITSKLLYQLNNMIIPALHDEKTGLRKIEVVADPAEEVEKIANYCGTGVSCGVDSFSAILMNLEDCVQPEYKLTHLAVFNTGALNYDGYGKNVPLDLWREKTLQEFDERNKLGEIVSEELGLKFIDIDSNIPEFYQGAFSFSHTYRNCSAVLATQKMWENYYYASAGYGVKTDMSLLDDSSNGDLFILPNISLNHLNFYSGDFNKSRLKKLEYLLDKSVAQKYLNVCAYETVNCGHCAKCIRTMMGLDLLGSLEKFKESFPDMNHYYSTRWKLMGVLLGKNDKDFFYKEMGCYLKDNKIKVGFKAKLYHYIRPLQSLKIIFRRLITKNEEK